MKAKVTINVLGVKVKQYEKELSKLPDIRGLVEEMRRLGVLKKVEIKEVSHGNKENRRV